MSTLDRYIIRQFFVNFAILLCVFMWLFVLVDFIAAVDEFVQAANQRQGAVGGFFPALLWVFLDYYGPVLIRIYVLISGLLIVGAVGFTLAAMAVRRELVAVLTSGLSLYRVAAPLLLCGIAINFLALPIQEFLIPPLAPRLVRAKSDLKRPVYRSFPVRFARDDQGNLITAGSFSSSLNVQKLKGLSVLTRNQTGQAIRRVSATEAIWNPATGVWDLLNGYAIEPTYDPAALAAGQPPEPKPVAFLVTSLTPEAILARQASAYPRLISISQLLDLAKNASVDRSLVVHIMHSRFSGIIVNSLLILLCLPFFLLRLPPNLTLVAGQAAAVCLVAWGLALLFSFYVIPGLNPVASAWLPVVILLPLTGFSLQFIRT
ncbi:MAG: LptF/LptG family permease [Phycisphaeraceae bacterium]|nr:LptF/LptG family permease [Phycisphaeraceae bacterium]